MGSILANVRDTHRLDLKCHCLLHTDSQGRVAPYLQSNLLYIRNACRPNDRYHIRPRPIAQGQALRHQRRAPIVTRV